MKRSVIFCGSAILLLAGCDQAAENAQDAVPEPRFTEAHNIKDFMKYVVDPQAQVFWQSVHSVSDEKGITDIAPTTDEEWLRVRSSAGAVTEMGNLMMTPLYAKGRGADWIQYSADLVKAGALAEKAAADKNAEAVFATGGDLYTACSACHDKYIPKPPDVAAAQPANTS